MKKVGLFLLFIVFLGVTYLMFLNVRNNSMYDEVIELHISPSNEECDDYDVLWKVDFVNDSSYSFIQTEFIYLLNSKLNYRDSVNKRYWVNGVLKKSRKKQDYLQCGLPWIFNDSLVKGINYNKVSD